MNEIILAPCDAGYVQSCTGFKMYYPLCYAAHLPFNDYPERKEEAKCFCRLLLDDLPDNANVEEGLDPQMANYHCIHEIMLFQNDLLGGDDPRLVASLLKN
jgi:hypothetical protein